MSEETQAMTVLYRSITEEDVAELLNDSRSSAMSRGDQFEVRDTLQARVDQLTEQNRELLEALKGMIVAYDDGVQPEWALPYIHAAHAAIRKATGEEA